MNIEIERLNQTKRINDHLESVIITAYLIIEKFSPIYKNFEITKEFNSENEYNNFYNYFFELKYFDTSLSSKLGFDCYSIIENLNQIESKYSNELEIYILKKELYEIIELYFNIQIFFALTKSIEMKWEDEEESENIGTITKNHFSKFYRINDNSIDSLKKSFEKYNIKSLEKIIPYFDKIQGNKDAALKWNSLLKLIGGKTLEIEKNIFESIPSLILSKGKSIDLKENNFQNRLLIYEILSLFVDDLFPSNEEYENLIEFKEHNSPYNKFVRTKLKKYGLL